MFHFPPLRINPGADTLPPQPRAATRPAAFCAVYTIGDTDEPSAELYCHAAQTHAAKFHKNPDSTRTFTR